MKERSAHPPRAVVERVRPEIDAGRFAVKRVVGEALVVEADLFADGHDVVVCELCHKAPGAAEWSVLPMEPVGNDRFRGRIVPAVPGAHLYTVRGFIDRYATFRRDLPKRVTAGQDVAVDLLEGARLVTEASLRALPPDREWLAAQAARLGFAEAPEARTAVALSPEVVAAMARWPDRESAAWYERELPLWVDRELARFSAWYELFPRSCASEEGRHGSLRDAEARLPYVAELGFDILYLPPIHPIGETRRKGRNGVVLAAPGDVGSPWAIGAAEGGHTAVHPDLGTLDDLRSLVASARRLGIEVALDVAFQCSPDHPWVREHPSWFRQRPDGSIQYAENPPKKYEDIFPLDFESADWKGLWQELLGVFLFWIEHGVSVFRVDNPHTKPFAFWEWVIGRVHETHPEAIFLSEAFTRPRAMYRLAKAGFTQSYTYFTWRHTKLELEQYLTELTRTEVAEYLRPNFWPNTPDILPESLQFGGRAMFAIRLSLAATLSSSYGIYGPAFELLEARARSTGSEEYLDSEKYELRRWDLDRDDSLRDLIARLNRIRRENVALQGNATLRFHPVDNAQMVAYSKASPDRDNVVLAIVNLDPHHVQSGFVELPLDDLGIDPRASYQVHDLLSGARYLWHGARNYVELDPESIPVHVLRIRRKVRTEHDFDYYL